MIGPWDEESEGHWIEVVHSLQDEIAELRKQLAQARGGGEEQEVWPESLLEAVDPGGGYTYLVPPPARKWTQGWRKRR